MRLLQILLVQVRWLLNLQMPEELIMVQRRLIRSWWNRQTGRLHSKDKRLTPAGLFRVSHERCRYPPQKPEQLIQPQTCPRPSRDRTAQFRHMVSGKTGNAVANATLQEGHLVSDKHLAQLYAPAHRHRSIS